MLLTRLAMEGYTGLYSWDMIMLRSVAAYASILLGLLFLGNSCERGGLPRGSISPSGFQHECQDLAVESVDSRIMPEGWRLDNYYPDAEGFLAPKEGPSWETTFHLDLDGDGKTDAKSKEFIYSLRYEHSVHDGTVFVRFLPFSKVDENRELRLLARSYVEGMRNAGLELVVLHQEGQRVTIAHGPEYSTTILTEGKTFVAGQPAWYVLLDYARAEDLKAGESRHTRRVLLVFVHTPFRWQFKDKAAASKSRKTGVVDFPGLVLAAYANLPEDFDRGLDDFRSFVDRIRIGKLKGAVLPRFEGVQNGAASGRDRESSSSGTRASNSDE